MSQCKNKAGRMNKNKYEPINEWEDKRNTVAWIKAHKPWVDSYCKRSKQTEPIDEYHIHYPVGKSNEGDTL